MPSCVYDVPSTWSSMLLKPLGMLDQTVTDSCTVCRKHWVLCNYKEVVKREFLGEAEALEEPRKDM